MPIEIGNIESVFRYPVKSMRGELLAAAMLGWHGLRRTLDLEGIAREMKAAQDRGPQIELGTRWCAIRQEEQHMTSAKIGVAVFIIVAGLAVPTLSVGHAQTAGRKYVYSKDPVSKTLPFSEAVRVGDTLYVAGHIGTDPKTGQAPARTEEEIKLLFEVFRADMAEANFQMDDLVSVRVYCTDLTLYAQFNTAYRTQFGKDLPARAFIGVASLLRSGHFEMEGIAVKNRS